MTKAGAVVVLLVCAAFLGLWLYDRRATGPGLVAHWAADGDAKDGVSGARGTLGGATFAPGVFGQAFSLDGSQSITIGDRADQNPPTITVSVWFTVVRGEGDRFFVNKFNHSNGTSADDAYMIGLYANGDARWQVDTRSAAGVADHILRSTISHVFDEGFHLLTGTYDGTTMRTYLDGRQVGSQDAAGPINQTSTPLIFGAGMSGDALGSFHKGLLDDIRVYPRALSAPEVEELFRKRGAGST